MDPSGQMSGLRPNMPQMNMGQMPWAAPQQIPNFPHQQLQFQQPFHHPTQQLMFQQPPQQHVPVFHESQDQSRLRFEIEAEFVQSLANPHYLNYLAQRGYFKEATFVRYLSYLRYFKQPDYAKTLKYPQCLLFLDLLQKAEFREAISSSSNAKFIEDQMLLQWHYYLRKRQKLSQFTITFAQTSPTPPHPVYKPPTPDEESEERSDELMDDQED